MNELTYYLYKEIPGAHSSWTLAVLALSKSDAKAYIKCNHPGAKCVGEITSGKVDASCGAVAYGAQEILHRRAI